MDELAKKKQGAIPETKDMSQDFFDVIFKLWEDGDSKGVELQEYYDYWKGKIKYPVFDDMKYTPVNVIGECVEAILSNVLDAQFTMGVNPKLNTYSDIETLKDHQGIADIYNEEMNNVLKRNSWDSFKENVARWGLFKFGASQTTLDDSERVEGEIKLEPIDSRNLRWNKGAKKLGDLTYIAYQSELNPGKVKNKWARDAQGNWNVEMCSKIDDLAESETNIVQGQATGVMNFTNDQLSGQAFVYDSKGFAAGKIVKVVVMFLLDDTLYSPEDKDSANLESEKQTFKQKYPNGRMIVFSAIKEKKVILEDKPLSESFKNLGNIDIFNAMQFSELIGEGILQPLIPIQDRINGALNKMRMLLKGHIKKLGVDPAKFPELTENAFVDNDIAFIEGLAGEKQTDVLQSIVNDTMPDVAVVWEQIKAWKLQAYETLRINPTLINGTRQVGTNSAEQVEALQEAPTTTIRGVQRNFKDYIIRVGEKVVSLIQNNYNVDRLIECSTGASGARWAKISIMPGQVGQDGQEGKEERNMVLYNEAMQVIKTLKINPDWEYSVDVSAGTDIPRTRRESADLTMQNFEKGLLGDIHDIDVIDQVLRAQDYTNRRAFVSLMRKKQEAAAKAAPIYPKLDKIMNSEILAKSVSDIIVSLSKAGFSTDIAAMLKLIGLTGKVDNMASVPVQAITSRSQISDVATIIPEKISDNPQKNLDGSEIAQADKIIKGLSPEQLGMALQYLTHLQDTQGGVQNA